MCVPESSISRNSRRMWHRPTGESKQIRVKRPMTGKKLRYEEVHNVSQADDVFEVQEVLQTEDRTRLNLVVEKILSALTTVRSV